jgi:hypothetical protein
MVCMLNEFLGPLLATVSKHIIISMVLSYDNSYSKQLELKNPIHLGVAFTQLQSGIYKKYRWRCQRINEDSVRKEISIFFYL